MKLAVFSRIVFKENINKNKIISLILCFIGAILAVTGGKLDLSTLSPIGILSAIVAIKGTDNKKTEVYTIDFQKIC